MSSRDLNSDCGKRGPQRTKADASTPAQWPYHMGEWDAPGQIAVTDNDRYTTEDDAMENVVPGPTQYNPVSKPVGKQS